jgi:hypothetical protein
LKEDQFGTMQVGQKLQVEVYGHGGWWKASDGRAGQVPVAEARKGPLAAVAMVANRFGMDGWELIGVASQPHGSYRLSFELAYLMEDADAQPPLLAAEATRS